MVFPDEKAKFEEIASLNGWDIAKLFNCHYSGDSDPLRHDGFFYDTREWEKGTARVVDFWHDYGERRLVVQRGRIYRPTTQKEWDSCWSCVDNLDLDTRNNIHAQIEATRHAMGIEWDGYAYPDLMEFKDNTWKEWRLWRAVSGYLKDLGS